MACSSFVETLSQMITVLMKSTFGPFSCLQQSEQSSNNNNPNINTSGSLLGESDQGSSRSPGSNEVLRPQHLVQQQPGAVPVPNDSTGSGSSTSIDFFGQRTALHHQQSTTSHHSIPTIPEERSTVGPGRHPKSGKPGESCSPDPQSSATTTGTTTSPTSVGNSSSPPPCETSKSSGPAPEFPSDSLQPVSATNALHGQGTSPGPGPWPASSAGMAPLYPSGGSENVAPYSVSPSESGRYNSANYPCAIKLLVSNNVAGSIIGRSGQTISELQSQSSTRIKLSQTGDYFPGSQDRVCLVQGQNENVKTALGLLLERLYVLQEHQHTQHMAWQSNRTEAPPTFDFVVRILVPTSSCGMIIGKSGSNIRQMEEASGVSSVRLSPKDVVDPNYPSATIVSATSERIVTLTGPNLESCLNCVFIILDGMTSHPDICRYTNMTTSYSRIMQPDSFVGGPPNLRSNPSQPSLHGSDGPMWETPHYPQAQSGGLGKRVSSSPDLSGTFLTHRPTPMPLDARSGPHMSGENVPYSPIFGGPANAYSSPMRPQGQPRMPQSAAPSVYLNHPMESPSPSSVHNSVSAPDLLALHLESMHLSSSPQHPPPPPPPPHQDYPLFPPQISQAAPAQGGFTAQVLVPDNMIGSILGRGGRTLNELQAQSGTRIRISQRGEYLPGTRNRIVTVRGATAQSVSLAQYLMSQRMILPRTATYQQPLRHGSAEQQPMMSMPQMMPPQQQQQPPWTEDQKQQVGQQHPPQQHGGRHIFHHHATDPSQQQPLQAPPPTQGPIQSGGSPGVDHPPAT